MTDTLTYGPLMATALERWRSRQTEPRPLRAALIDMDGTLYDSMKGHTAAWHRMMTELGVPTCRDEFYLYEGMTGASTIEMLIRRHLHRETTPEEVAELYHRKTVYFNEMGRADIMPGAPQMLASLKAAGITCVLVTGSGQQSLITRIMNDFPGVFTPELMITSRDVVNGKPHPEPYLKAMARAGVTPEESIVIENAPLGVQAGAASGAFTVGITTGPIPQQALIDAGADLVMPSMPAFAAELGI